MRGPLHFAVARFFFVQVGLASENPLELVNELCATALTALGVNRNGRHAITASAHFNLFDLPDMLHAGRIGLGPRAR